ncbi:neuromedin-U [Aplochiton taeniatus]
MKTSQCEITVSLSGSVNNLHSLNSSAMSPLSIASVTVAVLLISAIPSCKSAPAQLQEATVNQNQLLNQIDDVCSSYLSGDLLFPAPDVLGELCVLLLIQKFKAPGGIQSRGYFLYRPRNGRRSLEYE